MTRPLAVLQTALLGTFADLASPAEAGVPLAMLDREDWGELQRMVAQHRLGPLLHWRSQHERRDIRLPEPLRAACEQAFRAHAIRTLTLQRELAQVCAVLDAAGVRCIALKGAYLALHAYPHPATRPMRNLDVLVRRADAAAACAALRAAGYTQKFDVADLDEYLAEQHHLPAFRAPRTRVSIELHVRLSAPHRKGAPQRDITQDEGLWARTIESEVAGRPIAFLAPADLLLHLIVHAARDHRFDNGPLTLSDIGYLLARQRIDWPTFWSGAEAGGFRRACELTLHAVAHYVGPHVLDGSGLPARPDANVAALARTAGILMLRDFDARHSVHLQGYFDGDGARTDRWRRLLHEAFPPRQRIAEIYGLTPTAWRVYPAYVYRLFARAFTFAIARFDRRTRSEAAAIEHLQRWLADDAGA